MASFHGARCPASITPRFGDSKLAIFRELVLTELNSQGKWGLIAQVRPGLGIRDPVLVVPTWTIFFSLPGFSVSSAKERLACGSAIRGSKVQVGIREVGL